MIARREQALNYAILGVFSLIALYPIVGILLTALAPPGELAGFGVTVQHRVRQLRRRVGRRGISATYLRSSVLVAVSVVAAVDACSRSSPATRSG